MSGILCGIDRSDLWLPLLKHKHVCVLTHAPAVDRNYTRSADVLARSLHVTALCGPEHGLDGLSGAGEGVVSSRDPETGLPVYSLYRDGEGGSSLSDALDQADAAVCDFSDIGSRFYTYIWSMYDAMKLCAERGVPFFVLDRPDPIGGVRCEGPLLDPRFASFVGRAPIPVRHGLTLGEAALLFNRQMSPACPLTVIPVSGWDRAQEFEETGRVWIDPSPSMTGPDCARIYTGTCFLEGTNVSEGRGTMHPFEIVGAPFLDPSALSRAMNSYRIPGIRTVPCRFRPSFGKYAGEVCGGVRFLLTDRKRAGCFEAGIRLLDFLRSEVREFEYGERANHFDHLMGTDLFRLGRESADEFLARGREESFEFRNSVRDILLYEEKR